MEIDREKERWEMRDETKRKESRKGTKGAKGAKKNIMARLKK